MPTEWIHRRGKHPGHFTYLRENGARVAHKRATQIDALAIPPAWTDVHVAASDSSAIQAWGYDVRGRKQYRYHPRAIEKGQLRKYYRVRQMARDLPSIRRRVYRDFRRGGSSRERVIAGIVRFLAEGFFRIGNERYATENHTFGLTTLRKSHVHVNGDAVIFRYVGKRSIRHRQVVVNRHLAEFMTTMLETPGRRLFRYEEDGSWHDVRSRDVNDYIQTISGFPYSAKDFRTWGGTLRAATVLGEIGPARSQREAKKTVVTAMRLVAAELGNTPAICRRSYVHPVVIDRYIGKGATIAWRKESRRRRRGQWEYAPEERALISFLDTYFPERRRRPRNELP